MRSRKVYPKRGDRPLPVDSVKPGDFVSVNTRTPEGKLYGANTNASAYRRYATEFCIARSIHIHTPFRNQ
jgi:hypothetical protein